MGACAANGLELQSSFGRGAYHLSALLDDDDVVAYQTGTWLVDAVEVGDGSPPLLELARVDCLQINWTHNCEHGLVRGTKLCVDEDDSMLLRVQDEDVEFDPSQLLARVAVTWGEDGDSARLVSALPPATSLLTVESPSPLPAPPPPSAPPPQHSRSRRIQLLLECSEENVLSSLERFKDQATSMFGRHEQAAQIGITGDVALLELDGPIVILTLSGRFWHKRETVLRNAAAFLTAEIPEIAEVTVADEGDLLDKVVDDETGVVLEDRRSPDWNGDRGTLEYQGIDPDTRGPFPGAAGAFRTGGSMFS